MADFTTLLPQGAANAWLFLPSAVLLGALHGLEPGHSKTMMAAFIIAIRGTIKQAMMLGLAATVSHTAVVWLIALGGMYLSRQFTAEAVEPYFQLISGMIIVLTAVWMAGRIWRDEQLRAAGHDHHHEHQHHHHAVWRPDIGRGRAVLRVATAGGRQVQAVYQDAHEREHAEAIRRRFTDRQATNGQILLFGLTGGLIPCPAAITVLLLCIQVKAFTLGASLVLCFSIGLALTLVAVGVAAAVGVRRVNRRWPGVAALARRAPYFSSLLIATVGVYMLLHGWHALPA